jgi:tRNA threonylcarbamoyladenosine biosynthesis protein TsaB
MEPQYIESIMRFAAVETSTEWCSVALWRDGEVSSLERRAPNRHSELVLPMLERLFRQCAFGVDRLEAVAFGAGPGSFTGLRIACGIAQGLAFGRNIPVLGVSTLEALADEAGAPRVVACLDARMREVYYAALENRAAGWAEVAPAQCAAPEALRLPGGAGGGWVGAGNGFAAYGNMGLEKVLPQVHPTAIAVARLAAPRLAAGQGVDAALAVPLYVRDKVAFTTEELRR